MTTGGERALKRPLREGLEGAGGGAGVGGLVALWRAGLGDGCTGLQPLSLADVPLARYEAFCASSKVCIVWWWSY